MRKQTRLALTALLVVIAGIPVHGWAAGAKDQECWWCSSEELEYGEYCDFWLYKHAYMGMAGDYDGPPHAAYYCGFCSIEHNLCEQTQTAAAANVREAVAQGSDVVPVIKRHARFVRLDRDAGLLVVRDCRGADAQSFRLSPLQIARLDADAARGS
ncbi:MAG TPA: hypothetical protein VF665_19750 [Longimicrobium sp.]|jgi:hypothetical protein|uniref:hypothetical protein n=1 Tax=Longimicrobium sp. TaxID=2029185 RepID=UPI002EDB5238